MWAFPSSGHFHVLFKYVCVFLERGSKVEERERGKLVYKYVYRCNQLSIYVCMRAFSCSRLKLKFDPSLQFHVLLKYVCVFLKRGLEVEERERGKLVY